MLARWRTAALSALCALACAIPAVAAPAVPGCPGRDATGPDAWTTVRPTIGGKTGAPIVDMAVLPLDPDVMYATDGKAVAMTRDGGCTWRDVAGPDSGLPVVATREIVAIDVSQRSTDNVTTVWLLSNVTVLGTARPEVLVAEDGDTIEPDAMHWALGGTPVGLPLGKAVTLAAGTDPATAYVLVSVPGVGRQLLATQNRGELWEPRGGGGAGDARGVVVDSSYPNRLWTWGLSGLFYSADSGATMTAVEAVPGPVADVSVAQSPKGTRVLVLQPNGLLWRSDDGGETYTSTRVDVRTSTVAAAPIVDVAVAAGREIATAFPAIFTPYDVSPAGEVWFDDLAASLAGEDRVHVVGRTQDVLRVRQVDVELRFVPPAKPGAVDLRGPVERIPLYPALNPRTSVVTLRPGETREIDYRLELPATPTPIDVHFVVDTTGSMGGVINALRLALAKIVNDLTAAGIQASFGVGDFRDVPQSPWGSSGDHVYKLLRGIGPVDDELEDALNALQAGGGGDGPEALQFAVYEAVRHAAGMPSHLESPEGDTGWRDGALRMAILATDTSSHNAGEPSGQQGAVYPGPDYDQLVLALERANVLVMGIASGSEARSSLSEMAFDSGAVAPVAIDCNGDGRADIPEGEPLVCPFTAGALSNNPVPTPIDPLLGNDAKNMSSAVLAMLRGVRDPAAVDVRSSRPDVARVLDGGFRIDRKSANALPVRVRYTCSAENYGTTIPVRLPAYTAGRQVSEAAAEVRCGAPPGVRPVPPPVEEVVYPPAAPRPVPAAAAPPPPPPPAPVSQVNPNPNPHPNVNLQAGAAAEEQQMPQLAMALGDTEPAQEESLAMSRRDDTVPAAALLCAGVMMAGAAYGLQHRTRTAQARAHGPC